MPTNVLLLQGPMGPFFSLFSRELREAGNNVYKINFNGGDDWFYDDKQTVCFTGKLNEWDDFFSEQLHRLRIDKIYLFGDCRVYHSRARKIAINNGVRVFVFEEGYIRPNCITLEETGVNAHSTLPKKPSLYPYRHPKEQDALAAIPNNYARTARFAITYYIAASLLSLRYRHYQHHRPFKVLSEGGKWIVGAWRKFTFSLGDPETLDPILKDENQPYFFCPLQVSTDMQVAEHSRFRDMDELIQDVIHSFANYAPKNTKLIFKHHPLDRGYHDYKRVINVLSKLHGIKDRVIYIHECNLPEVLKKARATITINSTVGLSSIYHGTPIIALGQAIYNMEGLSFQGELDLFWHDPGEIDLDLYDRFRSYLLEHNQANGSFYKKLSSATTTTGIIWPESMANIHGLESSANIPTIQKPAIEPALDLGNHYNNEQSNPEEKTTEAASVSRKKDTEAIA